MTSTMLTTTPSEDMKIRMRSALRTVMKVTLILVGGVFLFLDFLVFVFVASINRPCPNQQELYCGGQWSAREVLLIVALAAIGVSVVLKAALSKR